MLPVQVVRAHGAGVEDGGVDEVEPLETEDGARRQQRNGQRQGQQRQAEEGQRGGARGHIPGVEFSLG